MKPYFPNHIMKNRAKAAMSTRLFKAFAITALPGLIVTAVTLLFFALVPGMADSFALALNGSFESMQARADYVGTLMDNCVMALNLFTVLFSFLSVGSSRLCLDMLRGKEVKIRNIFSYYNKWYIALIYPLCTVAVTFGLSEMVKQLTAAGISADVITLLAMVCDIIVLVLNFKLMFVEYALADNDCTNILAAVKASWKMVGLNTSVNLILLSLSFFGWFLLSAFTGGLLLVFLLPYMTLSTAALYDENLKFVTNTTADPDAD